MSKLNIVSGGIDSFLFPTFCKVRVLKSTTGCMLWALVSRHNASCFFKLHDGLSMLTTKYRSCLIAVTSKGELLHMLRYFDTYLRFACMWKVDHCWAWPYMAVDPPAATGNYTILGGALGCHCLRPVCHLCCITDGIKTLRVILWIVHVFESSRLKALSVSPTSTIHTFNLGAAMTPLSGNQLANASIVMLHAACDKTFCNGIEQHLLRANVGPDEGWIPGLDLSEVFDKRNWGDFWAALARQHVCEQHIWICNVCVLIGGHCERWRKYLSII